MYKLYKLIKWLFVFKKEKKDFELAAEFHKKFSPPGDEQDKQVGAALISAETSQRKFEISKELLKEYANSWFDGGRSE